LKIPGGFIRQKEDKMKKKVIALALALVLAFSSLNGFIPVEAENAFSEEKMTEALVQVKGKLDIGDEYTEFNYNYNEYSGNGRYYFNWSNEDGSLYINVNADENGRIYSYSKSYDYELINERQGTLPTYIGEELIPKAEEWIAALEPALKGKLKIQNCRYQTYRQAYNLSFVRIENGIDMNDNGVSVVIDAFDGEIYSYNINWNFEVSIPSADNLIGEKEASKKVGEKVKMNLAYRIGYDNEGKEKVFLAYTPDKGYVAVDAKNGKIYTEKVYWGSGTDFDYGFNETTDEVALDAEGEYIVNGKSVRLSESEIKKIDEIKDILTSEEAINLIKNNKKLYIDQNLTGATCRLYSEDGEYFWRINLSDERPYDDTADYYDYYRANANASINAKTGKLIYFYASTRNNYYYYDDAYATFDPKYTKKQCKNIFDEFLKETDPDKYEYLKSINVSEDMVYIYDYEDFGVKETKIGGYSFGYNRYYKNVPFEGNGASGAVEAVSGKIISYNVNWSDAEVPEPDKAIGEERAFDSYINYDGFDLVYELVHKYEKTSKYYGTEVDAKARLVYRTQINPQLVDAFTGNQLDWNGDEYKPAGVSFKYTDINGTKYERSIKLLADMGYGLDGEEFKPSEKITNADFEALLMVRYGGYRYYDMAISEGADEEDDEEVASDDETKVTRQEAAMLIIKAMGAEKLAKMDIFKTGYSDEKKIDSENIGAVALCKGLNIIGAKSGKKFKPNATITRGEAADMVIKMLISDAL